MLHLPDCCCCCLLQIIASDGVWDVMDAREAANRVMDVLSGGGTAEEAARQLVRDTVMLAECSPDGDADNTSAVVIVFE
jgi:serine/threonine protein phosphatase PrpC